VFWTRVFYASALALALGAPRPASGQEGPAEPETPGGYLPPSVYPAVYALGGVSRGPSFAGAADISSRAAAAGVDATLDDVGDMPAFGFGVEYFVTGGLAFDLKILHSFGGRREAALKYDYAHFPKIPPGEQAELFIEERLAYKLQIVDYKISLEYEFFPGFAVSPVAGAGLGGNSALCRLEDHLSSAWLQKAVDGLLLENRWVQQFSFDWAASAGVRYAATDRAFVEVTFVYDRPFSKHRLAGYDLDTSLTGLYAGAGWKFF
jgi:hypothetical protein